MIPVVTAEQMRAADAAALADVDDPWTFIRRAGHATAEVARTMMGGAYGRRVVVIAGKGNNGNDGRVAAGRLTEWGASVRVLDAAGAHDEFIDSRVADLVIDAAYGIGFRGTWSPPIVFDVPVLAVDIPSGVNGLTGAVEGPAVAADLTVCFAAWKPGLLFEPGRSHAGRVHVVDIGIPVAGDAEAVRWTAGDAADEAGLAVAGQGIRDLEFAGLRKAPQQLAALCRTNLHAGRVVARALVALAGFDAHEVIARAAEDEFVAKLAVVGHQESNLFTGAHGHHVGIEIHPAVMQLADADLDGARCARRVAGLAIAAPGGLQLGQRLVRLGRGAIVQFKVRTGSDDHGCNADGNEDDWTHRFGLSARWC